MKKTTDKKDSFKQLVHEMWDGIDDEMDRLELKGFIDDENQPRMRELNEADNIGVEEVLMVGSYMTLCKLHNELHRTDKEKIGKDLDKVLKGEMEFRQMTPGDMPEELVEALEQLVNHVKKKGKK